MSSGGWVMSGSVVDFLRSQFNGFRGLNDLSQLALYAAAGAQLGFGRPDNPHISALAGLSGSQDLAAHHAVWGNIADANDPTLRLFAPIIVAMGRDGLGSFGAGEVLLDSPPEGFPWIDESSLWEAIEKRTDKKGFEGKVRMAEAFRLQREVWARLQRIISSGGRLLLEDGVLATSRGDWEILMTMLLQQVPPQGAERVFAGCLSQGDQTDAIETTAGYHPRLGDLRNPDRRVRLREPLVMFPPEALEALARIFEITLWNPPGSIMDSLGAQAFQSLARDVLLFGATKTFGNIGVAAGRALTDRARELNEAAGDDRRHLGFGAGYTGAGEIIRAGRLPAQPDMDTHGIHLVLGVGQDDFGRRLGALLTGRRGGEELPIPGDERGRVFTRFDNTTLAVPVRADVVSDSTLRDVQAIASAWKNAGSFINGEDIFGEIYGQLAAGVHVEDVIKNITASYPKSMDRMIQVVREILIRVEGFDPGDVILLEGVLKDFYSSWAINDFGALVHIVWDIFFSGKEDAALLLAIKTAQEKMPGAFATRNPQGGFMMALWKKLVITDRSRPFWSVVPRKTYEGRNTLLHLSQRLTYLAKRRGIPVEELLDCLPRVMEEAMLDVVESVNPTLLPPHTRRALALFSEGIANISSRSPLSRATAAVLLGREEHQIQEEDIRRLERIHAHAVTEDLKTIMGSLERHITHALHLIRGLRGANEGSSARLVNVLRGMSVAMRVARTEIMTTAGHREMTSEDIIDVLCAIMHLINQGDYFYRGHDINRIVLDIATRWAQILLFLQGKTERPTLLLGDPFPELTSEQLKLFLGNGTNGNH